MQRGMSRRNPKSEPIWKHIKTLYQISLFLLASCRHCLIRLNPPLNRRTSATSSVDFSPGNALSVYEREMKNNGN